MPLIINQTTGKKFGKSEEGAVWLDPKKTTPTKFYQFWINLDDKGISDYLKIYTDFSKEKIAEIMTRHEKDPKERIAQKALAQYVTHLVHGGTQTSIAMDITELITGKSELIDIDKDVLSELKKELPYTKVKYGSSILEWLVDTGLAKSNTEARRLLEGGAVYINNLPVDTKGEDKHNFVNGLIILRRGKAYKDSALVQLIKED
jgi:tyrosyl-tRNA synthetase